LLACRITSKFKMFLSYTLRWTVQCSKIDWLIYRDTPD